MVARRKTGFNSDKYQDAKQASLDKQMRHFVQLVRVNGWRSGAFIDSSTLFHECRVYSDWEKQGFSGTLETNHLAVYDEKNDAFKLL